MQGGDHGRKVDNWGLLHIPQEGVEVLAGLPPGQKDEVGIIFVFVKFYQMLGVRGGHLFLSDGHKMFRHISAAGVCLPAINQSWECSLRVLEGLSAREHVRGCT